MGFGGKGANQCVMASKLGASAAMIAKVSFHETQVSRYRGILTTVVTIIGRR